MKKILLGAVVLVVVALAVTLVVKAGDSPKDAKKAKTGIVEAAGCGAVCSFGCDKGDESSCDPANCAGDCCDKEKGHD